MTCAMTIAMQPIRFTLQLLATAGLCLALPCVAENSDAQASEPPKHIAASCVECHGDGDAAIPGWPPIKFMTREEITTRLTAYRDRRMSDSRMNDVTHDFSDQDIEAIADYFARRRLQPPN